MSMAPASPCTLYLRGVATLPPSEPLMNPPLSCTLAFSLEGDEFETDEDNLAAWHEAFKQKHFWAAEVGPATFIGLSTVRFRRC